MLSNETATLEEVAAAIRQSPDWLKRHWLREHRKHGLPRKMACGWVWPRRAVEAWLRSGGNPPPAAANQNAHDDTLDQYDAALREKYGAN